MLSALRLILRKSRKWSDINRIPVGYCSPACAQYHSDKLNNVSEEERSSSPLKDLLENAASFNDINPKNENDRWATLPYPVLMRKYIDEESGIDPSDVSIILFPGQGTQFLGMGKDLLKFPDVSELFKLASEVVGIDLLEIKTEEELSKHAQEMIVVCSLAALEKLKEERPSALSSCVATAGFSLGEITALIFAGAIPLEQGLKLVSVRAAAMEAASKLRPGGMLTVRFGASANIKKVCAQAVEHCITNGVKDPFCCIANYIQPNLKVLSGNEEALVYIEKHARELGIRLTKRVRVSGAFHSPAVAAAVAPMKEALKLCDISYPHVRVMSGVDGMHYRNEAHIRNQLPKQISHSVRWEQVMHNLYSRPQGRNFPRTFEVGPGHTLRAILRQVNARAWDNSFSITV